MINKKRRGFVQDARRESSINESEIRYSFLNSITQKISTRVGAAAVSAIIALHFISQFIFFQTENAQVEENLVKLKNEHILEVKTEPQTVNSSVVTTSEPSKTVVQPARKIAPMQKTAKKKQARESKAERLRRAEKLLTGV